MTMTPPKKSHTLRNVLLIILALIVLSFVGCAALLGAVNGADPSVKASAAQDKAPGGPDNSLKINEGKAFAVSGFNYSAGWKLVDDGLGGTGIEGLKVTNNRDKKDSAMVEIKFMKGSEVLGLSDCTTEPIAIGQTTTLSCISTAKSPKGYDAITINDAF